MTEILYPTPGELYRILPDGRWALFFDSHTIGNFTKCEQYGVYNTLECLRLKGPERTCLSIGTWWSMVSEKFYNEMGAIPEEGGQAQQNQYVPITRMATIALEAWVENNMDSMAISAPKKYESFAMPTDASMFASMLGLQGFDHALMAAYQKQANILRENAFALESVQTPRSQQDIQTLEKEADRLDALTTLPLGPVLMACQYYQQYAEHDFKNWKIIGAEKSFGSKNEVLIGEDDKVVVFYHGRPDLVIYDKPTDQLMPLDQKTKDYIESDVQRIWKPHAQMAGYIYAVQKIARDIGFDRTVDRCLVSVCARNVRKTAPKKGESPKPRFARIRPTFNGEEIAEWQQIMMRKANRLRFAIEQNAIIRADSPLICHMYGGCEYRRICEQPPGCRDQIKQVDYVTVNPWSPLSEENDN